jgi:ADP-ribose pyrophosphatase
MFDGSKEIFERVVRHSSVTIIAVQDGKIVIQHQEQPHKGAFLSLPGGIVDEGEDVFEAAKRELLEETGLASEDWENWKAVGSNSYVHWENHVFIARNCDKLSELNLDAGERIENRLVNLDEFLLLAEDERFRHKDLLREIYRIHLYPKEKEAFLELLKIKES